MSTPADNLPPLVPVRPSPHVVPVPVAVESPVTKVARVFAIVRDAAIIALIVVVLVGGSRLLSELGDAGTGRGSDPAASCGTDQWGTFCEAPGG